MEKKLHTAFTGQGTHEDLVQKSGLRRILFYKSCLRRILFHKKSDLRRMFFIRNLLLNHSGCISFQVFYSVYQFISSENDLNSNTEWSQRRDCNDVDIIRVSAGVTVTVENKQQTWTKQSLPKRNLCVGCPIKSDQAIRSLCLKGHVRARGSKLWRHRWQDASEFFCTKTPLFWENWATKNIAKETPEMLSPTRYLCHVFNVSRLTPQKKDRAPRGFLKPRFN